MAVAELLNLFLCLFHAGYHKWNKHKHKAQADITSVNQTLWMKYVK